jgi:hypothetical protein
MPNSKKNKRAKTESVRDPIAKNKSKVVRGGYTGEFAATDFALSGHSSGSSTSEMDEISRKLSQDALVQTPPPRAKSRYDWQEPDRKEFEQLQKVPPAGLADQGGGQALKYSLWAAIGLAGAGAVAFASFRFLAAYQLRQSAIPVFPNSPKTS